MLRKSTLWVGEGEILGSSPLFYVTAYFMGKENTHEIVASLCGHDKLKDPCFQTLDAAGYQMKN